MPYTAKAVANEFLKLAKADGKQLTQMQLQKLVYFAYGWHLAITGERLLNERVEAWQWGPVVPSLYSQFKRFGSGPIDEFAGNYRFRDGRFVLVADKIDCGDPDRDDLARQVIRRVWKLYGKFTAAQLSAMTHEPDSPWSLTEDREVRGTDIRDDVIRDYFTRIAHGQRPAATG